MMLFVGSLVAMATYAVLRQAILPRARVAPAYYLAAMAYAGVICMICWCYWRTMVDDPGLAAQYGYDPFESGESTTNNAFENAELVARTRNDASFRQHVTRAYAEMLRAEMSANAPARPALAYQYETRPRWCKKCNAWKPPRSHHCSMAGACVLKMDHYCVWMGNTIGLLNYRSFVLFLAWTCVGCAVSAALLFRPSVAFVRGEAGVEVGAGGGVRGIVEGILGFISFIFTAAFTLALIGFLVMHSGLMVRNMTTIEAYEKRKVEPWPWDVGSAKGNLAAAWFGGPEKVGRTAWWRAVLPGVDAAERRRLVNECGHVKHRVDAVAFFQRAGVTEAV